MPVLSRFRFDYREAMSEHVAAGDESTLWSGYELGRRAVSEGVSALDLAQIHHDALESSLSSAATTSVPDVIRAGATFFQECLSAFEMVHRGYRDAAAAAAEERRHAAMLRNLSSFLADASLSARDSDGLREVIRLVTEHAQELIDASYCLATCTIANERIRAVCPDDGRLPSTVAAFLEAVESAAASLPPRVARNAWHEEPALRSAFPVTDSALSLLTAPIRALDGHALGFLQLVGKSGGDFTEVDEAVARHLADMTAASLERAELYRGSQLRW